MKRFWFRRYIGLLISIPTYGSVIATQTFDFTNPAGEVQATAAVTVLDNYHGDPTMQDWIYNITNLSFTAQPGGIGFPVTGLGWFGGPAFVNVMESRISDIVNMYPVNADRPLIGNISTYFCSLGCDFPGSFTLKSSSIAGVFPGQSATVEFSYLTNPDLFSISLVPASVDLGIIDRSIGAFSPALSGMTLLPLASAVPEPATMLLAATGFIVVYGGRLRLKPRRENRNESSTDRERGPRAPRITDGRGAGRYQDRLGMSPSAIMRPAFAKQAHAGDITTRKGLFEDDDFGVVDQPRGDAGEVADRGVRPEDLRSV